MRFQILVSTVNNNFRKSGGIYLIINQLLNKSLEKHSVDNVYTYYEKGLSKSRNKAISKSKAEICLISDDDLVYKENIETIIVNAFNENKDADIITFQVETPDEEQYKNYKRESFWHTKKTLMGVSSVEIAFRRNSIVESNLKFDERFGLGTNLPTGEEIIFLTDSLRNGLKILYIPVPIVIHPLESSGKDYDNKILIKAKGAMFYRIFGLSGYLLSILFAYKKHKLSKYSFFMFCKLMFSGISYYK
jgi:glycosyltransferase involved in cell wall biosynthesis